MTLMLPSLMLLWWKQIHHCPHYRQILFLTYFQLELPLYMYRTNLYLQFIFKWKVIYIKKWSMVGHLLFNDWVTLLNSDFLSFVKYHLFSWKHSSQQGMCPIFEYIWHLCYLLDPSTSLQSHLSGLGPQWERQAHWGEQKNMDGTLAPDSKPSPFSMVVLRLRKLNSSRRINKSTAYLTCLFIFYLIRGRI